MSSVFRGQSQKQHVNKLICNIYVFFSLNKGFLEKKVTWDYKVDKADKPDCWALPVERPLLHTENFRIAHINVQSPHKNHFTFEERPLHQEETSP